MHSEGDHRVDRKDRGNQKEGRLLAVGLGQLDGGEVGDRGATHADAEDTDGESTPGRRIPAGHVRYADGERGATDAEEEADDDQWPQYDDCTKASVTTGTIVARLTTGNMTRPPNGR